MATKKATKNKGKLNQTQAKRKPARVAKKAASGAKRAVAKAAKKIGAKVAKKTGAVSKKSSAKVSKKAGAKVAKKVGAKSPAAPEQNGKLAVGALAPSFSLPDQSGNVVTSSSLKGAPYVLYFYPKDDTPGCTKEACGFRDSGPAFGKKGVRILGVSPDSEKSHARFAQKYGLPFTLLSDADKTLANAYGVWVEKQNYGRTYMGVQRSTFLVDAEGRLQKIWRGVSVPGHVEEVLASTG